MAATDVVKNYCCYKNICPNQDKWIDTKLHVPIRSGIFKKRLACNICFAKISHTRKRCFSCGDWCHPETQMVTYNAFSVCFLCLYEKAKGASDASYMFLLGNHIGHRQLKFDTADSTVNKLVLDVVYSACDKSQLPQDEKEKVIVIE